MRTHPFLSFARLSCAVLAVALPATELRAASPGFGPHVLVFSPAMPAAAIQKKIDAVYAAQQHAEFGAERYALLFEPGRYRNDVPIGFYTQVLGLGRTPDAVQIAGNVHADASLPGNNATCTFWRAAEGLSVTPAGGSMQWAVSQAVAFRRMHVRGNLLLHQNHGWASGGWIADSVIDGHVDSGTQQQWITRDTEWGSWTGSNWNMVFAGVPQAPAGDWPAPAYTRVAKVPLIREKPFLTVDSKGAWSVRVPALRTDSAGVTWHGGETPGRTVPLSRFYLAQPGKDTAATLNAALERGLNLLLTPGTYELTEPLRVTRPNTVVYGLGFATLKPVAGTAALVTADADGIVLAGLLIDAGEQASPVLVQVGPTGSAARHATNPISLHDLFFRVGGAGVGRAVVNLEVNASDTLIDHTWIWRADHGQGVGWEQNTSRNGLVVNGRSVTAYGLFVEHHQQFQVLWNGEDGRTYFYQSEIPYDPPTQAAFTSGLDAQGERINGWASYKVADSVQHHEAWGLGVYSVFFEPNVKLDHAIEAPQSPGVRFHHMVSVALGDKGEITHIIDHAGASTVLAPQRIDPRLAEFP